DRQPYLLLGRRPLLSGYEIERDHQELRKDSLGLTKDSPAGAPLMTLRPSLTETDIRRLVKGQDADERAAAAHKLCRTVEAKALTPEDRAAAEGILRVLASDAAELVRRALSVTLKTSDLLPRDVALRLARDVESVALPVISGSPVFNDEDLVEIVRH